MNTANLQLEGVYAVLSALVAALRDKKLLTAEEIDGALAQAERQAVSGRAPNGDLSPANMDAILLPARLLRLVNSHPEKHEMSFSALAAEVHRTKPPEGGATPASPAGSDKKANELARGLYASATSNPAISTVLGLAVAGLAFGAARVAASLQNGKSAEQDGDRPADAAMSEPSAPVTHLPPGGASTGGDVQPVTRDINPASATTLDRDPPAPTSDYANTAAVAAMDRPLLESETGRVPSTEIGTEGSAADDEIAEKSVGTRPVSDRTDFRLSGTGAIETDDGLDETAEMVRQMTEDTTDDEPSEEDEDVPVFDRGTHI